MFQVHMVLLEKEPRVDQERGDPQAWVEFTDVGEHGVTLDPLVTVNTATTPGQGRTTFVCREMTSRGLKTFKPSSEVTCCPVTCSRTF